jgi:hypothetical protein
LRLVMKTYCTGKLIYIITLIKDKMATAFKKMVANKRE